MATLYMRGGDLLIGDELEHENLPDGRLYLRRRPASVARKKSTEVKLQPPVDLTVTCRCTGELGRGACTMKVENNKITCVKPAGSSCDSCAIEVTYHTTT